MSQPESSQIQDRIQLIRERLQTLAPSTLEIIDESHLHAGHAGAETGASHLRVIISSPQFNGLRPLARHRLVYDQVQDLIPFPIHALAIVATANA
ncbi:BolA family transcriptional regulator [Neopusillimonas maritima]|jgi:BolA protein|uniref:BolA family transcriptional regulator n=1 Tax=Neopusillimonas maritima TaxID=2026239 RepID=A0ABX9MZZ1_9BURK|nr:BolA family protein [Neopusillimonas maritima]RII84128.1 BolA family transcriptional regulator [Neopusillimonas maritima]|tara:strand:+ start:1608 stop:1892 length:285 start_codon:yes stop_codon:yes gene_type:complete